MLDVPTLLLTLVLNALVLAGALWAALPRSARLGAGAWTASLLLQAVAFAFFLLRERIGDVASIAGVQATAALSLTLQAAALREFHRRRTPLWWHPAAMLAALALFTPLARATQIRLILAGVVYGGALAAIAVTA